MILSAKKKWLSLLLCFPWALFAQPSKMPFRDRLGDTTLVINTAVKEPKQKPPPALRKELNFGLQASTDGYGIVVENGWIRSESFPSKERDKLFHVRLLHLEIGERKHSKEISGGGFGGGNYILGKVNNFYTAKLGYGRRQMLAGKPDPGCVSIHWAYMGGFSAALLKPYYLNVNGLGEVKYADSIASYFISPTLIAGKSAFTKGFSEIEFVPGAFGRTGLHFDWAQRRKGLVALEVGVAAEYYSKKILQMVGTDPKSLFLSFYASFHLGKRW